MVAVSIVIITKDQAEILVACVEKAKQISDDIVIIDNNYKDDKHHVNLDGCRILKRTWDGYAANKNKGIAVAKYDWILSIDSDEVADDELIATLNKLNYTDPAVVYDISFRAYFGKKMIRFGRWGNDHHTRLFNRKLVSWLDTPVHETLNLSANIRVKKAAGHLHHYSVNDAREYDTKSKLYAELSAVKYLNSGKKAGYVKRFLSPIFGFLKNYIFYLGFLDGRAGWDIARITLKNTRRKYDLLNQMRRLSLKPEVYNDSFVIEY